MSNEKKNGPDEWTGRKLRPKGYEEWRKDFRQGVGVARVLSKFTDAEAEDFMTLLYAGPRLAVLKNSDLKNIADNLEAAGDLLQDAINRLERHACFLQEKAAMLTPVKALRAHVETECIFLRKSKTRTYRQVDHLMLALYQRLKKNREIYPDICCLLTAAEIPNDDEESPAWEPSAVKKRIQRFSSLIQFSAENTRDKNHRK